MKKFFLITVVMFILGMFIAETAHAQTKNTPAQNKKVEQWMLNSFEPKEEVQNYLNSPEYQANKPCGTYVPTPRVYVQEPVPVMSETPKRVTEQFVTRMNGLTYIIRKIVYTDGEGQDFLLVWRHNTEDDIPTRFDMMNNSTDFKVVTDEKSRTTIITYFSAGKIYKIELP